MKKPTLKTKLVLRKQTIKALVIKELELPIAGAGAGAGLTEVRGGCPFEDDNQP